VTVGIRVGVAQIRSLTRPDLGVFPLIANLQTTLLPDQPPTQPIRLATEAFDPIFSNTIERQAKIALPPLTQQMPSIAGSAVLDQIASEQQLVVGIDNRLEGSADVVAFIQNLATEQGKRWGVTGTTQLVGPESAAEELASGQIQLWVSPDPLQGAGKPIQLAGSPDGQALWMTSRDDPKFATAQRNMLDDLVSRGTYVDLYSRSFDNQLPAFQDSSKLVEISRLNQALP
jgi:hypothetical protein